jgi:type IV pilus assembly protein PilA
MLKKIVKEDQKGFTLIELMIVIAIIGILAAIAIPQFSAYRTRSYNASANADLRNLATAQEGYYADESTYCHSVTQLVNSYGAITSSGVTLTVNSASISFYNMIGRHSSGDRTYEIRGPGGSVQAM